MFHNRCHPERNEVESKDLRMGLVLSKDDDAKIPLLVIPPEAYFLTDEKVGKESPRNFRMFLGLFRRTKGGSEGSAASGRASDPSEWPRSKKSRNCVSPKIFSGTATGCDQIFVF